MTTKAERRADKCRICCEDVHFALVDDQHIALDPRVTVYKYDAKARTAEPVDPAKYIARHDVFCIALAEVKGKLREAEKKLEWYAGAVPPEQEGHDPPDADAERVERMSEMIKADCRAAVACVCTHFAHEHDEDGMCVLEGCDCILFRGK
jgi:hypothetical protein